MKRKHALIKGALALALALAIAGCNNSNHTAAPAPGPLEAGSWSPAGEQFGGDIQALALDGSQDLYAGTINGVFKSAAGNGFWQPAGLAGVAVRSLRLDPADNDTLYAATWLQGLWRSPNGGATWEPLGMVQREITDLAADPSTPGTLIAGSGFGGIYRSADWGLTWGNRNMGVPFSVRTLAFHPTLPGLAFAGTSAGLFRSDDGGTSWQAGAGIENQAVEALAFDPVYAYVLYAATEGGGFFMSPDGGRHWTPRNNGLNDLRFYDVKASPVTAGTVYLCGLGGVYISIDEGRNWTPYSQGFTNWEPLIRALAVEPGAPLTFFAGSFDSGVWARQEGAAAWAEINQGLSARNIRALAHDPESGGVLYKGTDFGLYKSENEGGTWNLATWDQEISDIVFDPRSSRIIYASFRDGVLKSPDAGVSWMQAGLQSGFQRQVEVLAVAPSDPLVVYAGTMDGVFRSGDGGAHWQAAGALAQQVQALAVDPADSGTVWAGTRLAGLHVSHDAGQTWAPSGQGMPATDVRKLLADPGRQGLIYAGTAGGLFRSLDGGLTWAAFGGLGNEIVTSLAQKPGGEGILYAGTFGAGVFEVNTASGQCGAINDGLGNLRVRELAADHSPGAQEGLWLYCGTHGGGVYVFDTH